MAGAEKMARRQRQEVKEFLQSHDMNAWDLHHITKTLCSCGTCKFFTQHYTKQGEPLDWGHCNKGNIQHSKKPSTACCGYWQDGEELEEEDE